MRQITDNGGRAIVAYSLEDVGNKKAEEVIRERQG